MPGYQSSRRLSGVSVKSAACRSDPKPREAASHAAGLGLDGTFAESRASLEL